MRGPQKLKTEPNEPSKRPRMPVNVPESPIVINLSPLFRRAHTSYVNFDQENFVQAAPSQNNDHYKSFAQG